MTSPQNTKLHVRKKTDKMNCCRHFIKVNLTLYYRKRPQSLRMNKEKLTFLFCPKKKTNVGTDSRCRYIENEAKGKK